VINTIATRSSLSTRVANLIVAFQPSFAAYSILLRFALFFTIALSATAQPAGGFLNPIPSFPLGSDPLTITRAVEPTKPFTVAGERGAIFGEQSGKFEAWIYPVKIFSAFSISAELEDYPVPIDVSALSAVIEVAPEVTTITYSHAAFTVKQHMFAARADSELGAVVLFEIDSVRPLRLTFRFKPEMLRMWPAPNFGSPNAEWVADGGYYVLHTDDPNLSALIAMPRTEPGILPPYQERPHTYPTEIKLAYHPKTGRGLFFPLLFTLANQNSAKAKLAALNNQIPELYRKTREHYARYSQNLLTSETPDPEFDHALRWAAIAIDQGKVRFHDETGLIAGYYESGDSARPGYAWFFGRDSLWTSYAINGYGDFESTRQALEFLIRRQRADGKIMHEFSQTADLVDWKSTPYFYAEADSSALFVMAMEDYVNTSGDVDFLRRHWDSVKRAYAFTRAHDSDGDGIYENTEGTGWVESWPPGMPHQEIYLAALDQQSADAMSRLATVMNEATLASEAHKKAEEIRGKLDSEYFDASSKFYAFSRNADGTLDRTATIYPAVAWWTAHLSLPHADAMLSRWASSEFSADWGTRDISERTPFYDPISYHQGSIWPLFTGWVALAEYRAGRTLSGYAHLMQNAGLTWAQDLGSVTELLSGEFYQPLGRSSSHQVWSSAMVATPALRGLFGLDWDALNHTLRLAPHLPAEWDHAALHNVPLGNQRLDLEFTRQRDHLLVRGRSSKPEIFCLVSQSAPAGQPCHAPASTTQELMLPLSPVEVGIPNQLPLPGARTSQLKVVGERHTPNEFDLDFEALGGSEYDLPVRITKPNVQVKGAELTGSALRLHFPAGAGYQPLAVSFSW
jgi:glycogen debranching enzyme